MNQKEKAKEPTKDVKEVGEKSTVKEKEMSFRSMLEQFYKKSFESLPEPETPPNSQPFIASH
ncbi:MAG: hypothetical protein ABI378_02595 [Chitinophagaceae bacterium]